MSSTEAEVVAKEEEKSTEDYDKFKYDKEAMLQIAVSHPACMRRPKCLPREFDTEVGLWSPENWLKSIWRVDSPVNLPPSVPAVVSRPKKKTSESESVEQLGKKPTTVDRLKLQAEEDVVLSPQRRSFGAGCHVTGKRNASPREDERGAEQPQPRPKPAGPGGNRGDRNGPHNNQPAYQRRDYYDRSSNDNWNNYGSSQYSRDGRNEPQDRRNFDRRGGESEQHQNEYDNRRGWGNQRDGRRDGGDIRNSGNNRGGGRQNWYRDEYEQQDRRSGYHQDNHYRPQVEKEPEWMSDGPTSMLDTIELVGFDDDKTRRNESPRQPAKETKTVKEGAVRRSPIGAAQGQGRNEENEVVPTDPTIPTAAETFPDFDINKYMHATLFGMDSPIVGNFTQTQKVQAETAGSSRFSKFFQSEEPGKDDQNNNDKQRELFQAASAAENSSQIMKIFSNTGVSADKTFEGRATNLKDLEASIKGLSGNRSSTQVSDGNAGKSQNSSGILQDLFKSAGANESRVSMPSLPNPPSNAMTEEQLLATLMKDKKQSQPPSDGQQRSSEEQLRQIISHHQQQPSQSSQMPMGGRPAASGPTGINPLLLEAMQKLQLQQQQQLSGYPTNVMQHQAMMEQMAQQTSRAGRVPSPISDFNQHLAALQQATQHSQVNQIQLASQQNAILQALASGKISQQELIPHMQNIYQRAMMNKKAGEQQGDLLRHSGQPGKSPAMTAFTPTSVLKQLHSAAKSAEGSTGELKVDISNAQRPIVKGTDPSRHPKAPQALSPGGSGQQVSPAEMAKIMEAQKSMQRLMMAGGNSAEAIKHQQMLASAMASRLPPPPMPYNMAALNNPMSMPMALRAQQAAALLAAQQRAGMVDPRQRAALQQQLSYLQQQQLMGQAQARARTPQPGPISATNLPPALLEMLQLQAARTNQQTAAAMGIRSSTSPQNFPFGMGPPGGISLPQQQQQTGAHISPPQMSDSGGGPAVSSVLNKWFSDEVLRHQQQQGQTGLNGQESTALTLEELEKLHRSQKTPNVSSTTGET